MDKRSLVLYLSGLAAAGAVVGLAASCSDQPRIKCTAGHGSFAVVYATPPGAENCGIKGELIGIEAYNDPLKDKSNLDPNNGSLGMQPVDLAGAIDTQGADPIAAHLPYSLGKWLTPEPAADNFCTVNAPNDIEQDLPFKAPEAFPDGGLSDPIAAVSFKYQWSNVHFYNTPASPGTQLLADLTYTKTEGLPDGGMGMPCTATFHVVGLWPAVSCSSDPLPDGSPNPEPLDPTKCSPEPDDSKGRATGSGISPDLVTRCDPDLQLCVLAKDPPAFK